MISDDKVYTSNAYLLLRDLCLYRIWKSNPKAQTKHQQYIMVNFQEKQPHDVRKAYGSIQSGIDMFINLSSNTAKIPIKLFSPWKKIIK